MLPLHKERKVYFTATELFSYMLGDFTQRRRQEQSPSLRSLTEQDGEFQFCPDPDSNFDQYREKDINIELLRAMVPGEYGNWWFDEMPWFIPSLRMAILAKRDLARGPYGAISREELAKAAERIKDELRKEASSKKDPLTDLRFSQLQRLLNASKDRGMQNQREVLLAELLKQKEMLEATDLHFMAVLQHRLGKQNAEDTYTQALAKYKAEGGQVGAAKQSDYRALEALCLADYGYYKFSELNECKEAAEIFAEAGARFGPLEAPPPFQVFILCREADALQRLGRWGLALTRLDQAIFVDRIDPDQRRSLSAHTMSRRGWAFMEQWKFKSAENGI